MLKSGKFLEISDYEKPVKSTSDVAQLNTLLSRFAVTADHPMSSTHTVKSQLVETVKSIDDDLYDKEPQSTSDQLLNQNQNQSKDSSILRVNLITVQGSSIFHVSNSSNLYDFILFILMGQILNEMDLHLMSLSKTMKFNTDVATFLIVLYEVVHVQK